jgi:zinc/manganese transport system substrate-binding protein
MQRRAFLALGLFATTGFVSPLWGAGKLKVAASFSILADMARQVGGDYIDVTALVGPGGDAHAFDPAPADAKALAEAQLFIVNGLGFEPWQQKLIEASGFSEPIIVASEGVAVRPTVDSAHDQHEAFDPHAWQDVRNGVIYVKNIAAALARADAINARDYMARAQAYVAKLNTLDTDVRARFTKIPEAKRKAITSHDAFGYFGEAYGIRFLAPEGLSTESEPAAGDVAKLITLVRSEGIKAFFLENISNPRMIEMIASETGAAPGGILYSDALSPPGGQADSYIAMIQHNARTLIENMTR